MRASDFGIFSFSSVVTRKRRKFEYTATAVSVRPVYS